MSLINREQRYTISVMYKQGYSQKSIADAQQLAGKRKKRFRETRHFNEEVKHGEREYRSHAHVG